MVMGISILRAGDEAHTIGVEGNGMDSTEMTLDARQLLIVYYVVQLHVETTLLLGGHRDILSVLATAAQNVELLVVLLVVEWAHSSISARELILEFSDLVESHWVEQLAVSVSTAGENHSEILGDGNGENLISMNILGQDDGIVL